MMVVAVGSLAGPIFTTIVLKLGVLSVFNILVEVCCWILSTLDSAVVRAYSSRSTWAPTLRPFLEIRNTKSVSFIQFRSNVEDLGRKPQC